MPTIPESLRLLLLGRDPRQQLRASQALLVLGIYAVFACVQHLEVLMGLVDPLASCLVSGWNLLGGAVFYGLIRSGLNLRRRRDRALSVPQAAWAMVGIAAGYGISGPARGAVMLVMLLVLMFGMFSLTPAQSRFLAAAGFAMLGAVMVWKAVSDPVRYDPRVEGLHLAFAGIVMAAVASLSIRIGRLREHLQAQRSELARALQRIQALATHDELTGLTNRRAVLERMHQELAVRGRPAALMSLALIDIDHFKRVNDTHGHAAGDAVLRRFAADAQTLLRAGDVLARWGGEEFLLVMPATPAAEALAALGRLRAQLRDTSYADVAPGLAPTFSAGVAECVDMDDLEAAIARADAAMYEAKRAGRDRSLPAAAPPALPPATRSTAAA